MDQSSLIASQTRQVQPIHWALLIVLTFLTILIIVIPVILFIMTRNVFTFAPVSGLLPISYAWKALLHYFLPKDPQDYELEKEKIRAKYAMRQTIPKP
jgi:archaellum biogenesis protein FlaJ (TadC family)